ncbi:MAG: prepilin-type N-terminal cleavage/methylation domain-containing protein [Rhodothermales bacterium]|nr:prepilin-type N-terminal cleavage/methylation domain-containing protein [Rhodothermales bacterium]
MSRKSGVASFSKEDGFSLTELLVVLVIVGILVAVLALPRFTSVMTKAKTTEARLMLRQVHALQQAYYFEHDMYSNDLGAIGFEQAPLQSAGGSAYYLIELSATSDRFTASATSSVDFDRDGIFNIWEVGPDGMIHETVKD